MLEAAVPTGALAPVLALGAGFVGFCWWDIARSRVRHLPKLVWALICLVTVPLGGICYLLVGREHG